MKNDEFIDENIAKWIDPNATCCNTFTQLRGDWGTDSDMICDDDRSLRIRFKVSNDYIRHGHFKILKWAKER